jgi:hypothetical protein
MKIRLAFREVGPRGGGWGIYAPSRSHGVLAANDNVVRPLVKDGVAGFGAHHEVVSGRRVEINLCEACTAVGREVADIVTDDRAEGAVV